MRQMNAGTPLTNVLKISLRHFAALIVSATAFSPSAFGLQDSSPEQRNRGVVKPSKSLIDAYRLDKDFYTKHLNAGGLPLLASEKVSDFALLEANWIIDQMLEGRPDIREAIISKKIRVVIMAPTEMTTDLPEHSDLKPAAYWDKRARGLGATDRRPAVSCGAENLLEYKGDPYRSENILIHEFAHVIHQHGLQTLDPDFDKRLRELHRQALQDGLWKNKYAGSNHSEYFAEAVQSWFGTNRENDHDHNHVNTRSELKQYDPRIAALMQDIFGDNDWTYVVPSKRKVGREHLEGFDPARAPKFAWPAAVSKAYREHQNGANLKHLANLKSEDWTSAKSPNSSQEVSLTIKNQTNNVVSIYWISYQGKRVPYGQLNAGGKRTQSTFAGHLWELVDSGELVDSENRVLARFKTANKNCMGIVK